MAAVPPQVTPAPQQPTPPPQGSGCVRWLSVGCGVAVVVLILVMVATFFLLRRGTRWVVERARQRIEERLPSDLTPAERKRVREDLQRFFERLPERPDSERLMGEFLARAGDALEDGRLTRGEVLRIDAFLRHPTVETAPAAPAPAPTPAGGG